MSNDGTGTEFPNPTQQVFPTLLPPARGTSRYGLNVSGTPFTVWGALVGLELRCDEQRCDSL